MPDLSPVAGRDRRRARRQTLRPGAADEAHASPVRGVLEVERGTLKGARVARVTYDAKTATLPPGAVVHAGDDASFAPSR